MSPPPPQTPVSPNVNGSSPISPESSNPSGNGGISTVGLVAIGVAVGLIALTLIGLVVWCLRKRRKEPSALHNVYVAPSPLGSPPKSGEGRPVLDWATRVKIAAGAAHGIAYLHEDYFPFIPFKLAEKLAIIGLLLMIFIVEVSDFGLAKLALDANSHITTRVMGTFGNRSYCKIIDARPLLSQALDNEEFDGLADPKLGKDYVESEMFRMIEAAAACVRHSAAKRPRMGQVVRAFDSLATSDLSNGMRVGESEIYNSAQQSEEIRWFRRMAFGSQNYSTDFFSQVSRGS
ncbi:hypothetical protein Patl1_16559 [Pistacia atlantica]|uniref:Uncharacterized protein n=1 Tax=Pistacia atlantica TaxID=434234 RepID=A0ACC1B8X0_9ROSI|nr:hypothetical protein Patl1_16559 [Pistacia atlantica]